MATVDENEVKTVFTATTDQFVSHVAQIREVLQGLASPLRALRTNLGEVAEAFAAAFAIEKIEQFIDKISEMGAEVEHATHELGMSADEVTTITTAFTLMGLSTERGIFSLERLERSMTTARNSAGPAAEAFTALGIPLDQLKTMNPNQVLEKMADVFSTTRDGANKTAIAMALFGRAGAQMIPWLDRGREGLEEFRRVAEETGVNMSGPMVRGMEETKIAMSTLDLAFKGLQITIYEAFKPQFDTVISSLIEFVEWVNEGIKGSGILNGLMALLAGTTGLTIIAFVGIVDALRTMFAGVSAFFESAAALWPVAASIISEVTSALVRRVVAYYDPLFTMISNGWMAVSKAGSDAMAALLDAISPMIRRIGSMFETLFTFVSDGWEKIGGGKAAEEAKASVAGIAKAFADSLDVTEAKNKSFGDEVRGIWDKYADQIQAATGKVTKILEDADKDGAKIGEHFINTMNAIVANIKGLNIDTTGDSLLDRARQRRPPQKDAPAMNKIKPNDEKMAELEAELHREEQGWQIHWDQLKEFEAAFWEGILKRTDVNAKDYNAIVNKAFSSQEALAHERVAKEGAFEKEVTANKKAALEDKQQQEKAADDFSVQHGLMKVSAQIAAERKLTEDTFKQIRDRLEYEKNTVGQMPEFYRKVNEEILQLERKHNGDIAALNRDAVANFIKPWEDMTAAINSSMDTMLNGVLMGTQKFSDAMKNMWNNLILTLIEYEMKLLITKASNAAKEAIINNTTIMSWFGMETAKTTASITGSAVRSATAVEESSTGLEASAVAGSKSIMNDAYKAAAGAYASAADIPYVGWLLAPVAGAAAFAAVAAFDVLSAEGGMVVPSGINPLVQLHQDEMVLPSALSQGVQGLIASGGGGGGVGDTTINVHVAGSNASPDSIARAVSQAMRDFHPAFRRR